MNPTDPHDHFDDWAAAALADGLTADEQTAFASHLAACPRCRALYQNTQAMHQSLTASFDSERPAPNFTNKLVAAFREGERPSWFAQLPGTIAWLLRLRGVQTAGVLAALTLLVTVGNVLNGPRFKPTLDSAAAKEHRVEANAYAANPTSDDERADGSFSAPLARAESTPSSREIGDLALNNPVEKEPESLGAAAPVMTFKAGAMHGGSFSDAKALETQTAANALAQNGDRDKNNREQKFKKQGQDGSPAQSAPASPAPASEALPPVDPAAPAGTVDSRKLIRNANVELEVASFDTALDQLTTAATQAGGYIATKNSAKGGNGKLRGTIIIKVLPPNLDSFLLEIRSVGDVKNQTLGTQDVTSEYTDTASRLRNSQRMEDRLLKMLDEAKGKMSEILSVEKELGRVRESIETMQGQLKLYDSLVAYATVTLSLYEKDLHQPAAFLLRQTGNLSLLAADVEKTYAEARRIAESVQAQIGDANLSRDSNGRISATLQLILPAPETDRALRQLKDLGRIANFTSETQRIAQNGSDNAGSPNAKVENAPAVFRLTIEHDEQTHRQIRFNLFAKDLDLTFDAAKKAALQAEAEIVSSNLVRPRNSAGHASLILRVPAAGHTALVATLQTLGRPSDYQIQRDATTDDTAPVLVSLNLTDEEPSVQQTSLDLRTDHLEKRVQEYKRTALAAGATVRDSSFQRQPDGRETARLLLRLPLHKYSELLAQAQALGTTRQLTVQRRDIAAGQTADHTAPAELSITFATEGKIVADNSGLLATLRRTLGQAIASLLWSLQMIGIAVAFLAPWAVGLALAWWITARLRRRKKSTPPSQSKPVD